MSDLPDNNHADEVAAPHGAQEEAQNAPVLLRKRPPLAPGLYVVATPIGNLEDITLRALRVLREVDRIGCEDTRQTHKLLHQFGISTPTVSLHRHNEHQRSEELLGSLRSGARIALVSDAGTPGIADPGTELIRAAVVASIPVVVIPGPSALLAAVVGSGLAPTDTGSFRFHGFLPARAGERRTVLERLRADPAAQLEVFYEAPHRLLDALADLDSIFGPAQVIGIARELTKVHEEFVRGSAAELRSSLAARPGGVRGEVVLLLPLHTRTVEAHPTTAAPTADLRAEIRDLIDSQKLSEMAAIKQVARSRGLGKSEVYREWQRSRKG